MNTPLPTPPAPQTRSDPTPNQHFPYWRMNLRILPLANLLTSMGFAMSFPFLPIMVRDLGIHDHLETWVGNMMMVFYIISFLCGPIWGGIADHFGRKIMVLRAMLGMGIFMSLIPLATTPLYFAFLFCLVGFFNGSSMSAQSLMVANTPPKKLGIALSSLQTAVLVGQTLGPVVATVAVSVVFQPQWLFWLSGAVMLLASVLVIRLVKEVKQLAPGPWKPDWIGSLSTLLKVPRIGALFFLGFMNAALGSGNITILSVYVLQLLTIDPLAKGSPAFWIGAVAMGLAVSSVISLTLCGRLIDRIKPERVLLYSIAGAGLSQIPLLFLHTPLQLVICRVAFGLSASLMLPCIIRLLKSYAPHGMDARAISYATAFQFIAIGLAPFSAGLIGPALGLRWYFALTVAMSLLAFLFWLYCLTNKKTT